MLIDNFEEEFKKQSTSLSENKFLENATFINQRFKQISQIFRTFVHFHTQLIQNGTAELLEQNNKKYEEIKHGLIETEESLKRKVDSVNFVQGQYFKICDNLYKNQGNQEKEKSKQIKEQKIKAEEKYKNEFVK